MKTEGKTEAEVAKAYEESADNIVKLDPFEIEIETSEEVYAPSPIVVASPPKREYPEGPSSPVVESNPNLYTVVNNSADGSRETTYNTGNMNKEAKVVDKDKDGNVLKIAEYNYSGDYGHLTDIITKDADNNLTSSIEFEYPLYSIYANKEIHKDADGNVEHYVEFERFADKEEVLSSKNTFDANGNITESVQYKKDETRRKSFTRTYDADGNATTVYRDGKGREISEKKWNRL